MATAAQLQVVISGDARQVTRALAGLSGQLGNVRQDTRQAGQGFAALTGAFAAGQVAASAFMGVLGGIADALVENVRAAFDYNATIDAQTSAYESLLGSAEAAQAVIEDLVNFANRTPFDTKTVIDFGQKLLNAGQSAESLIPTMEAVGNMAAASGNMTSEAMGRVALALSQVASAGKLQGDELNQLSEAGVNALGAIQAAYGLTRDEVVKLKEAGEITAEMLIYSLQKMGLEGAKFAGGMAKNMEKPKGALEGLMSNLEGARARVLKPFTQMMDELAIAVAKFTSGSEFEQALRVATGLVEGFTDILQERTIPALKEMGLAGKEAAENTTGFWANLGVGAIAFGHGVSGAIQILGSLVKVMGRVEARAIAGAAEIAKIIDAAGHATLKKDAGILFRQLDASAAKLEEHAGGVFDALDEGAAGMGEGWSKIINAQRDTLFEMLTVRDAINRELAKPAPAGKGPPKPGEDPGLGGGADEKALAKFRDSLRDSLEKESELRSAALDRDADLRAAFYDKIEEMDASYLSSLRATRMREEDVEEAHLERMAGLRVAFNADRKKGQERLAELAALQATGFATSEEAEKVQAERLAIEKDLRIQADQFAAMEQREAKYRGLIEQVQLARSPAEVEGLEDQIRALMRAERDASRLAGGRDLDEIRQYQSEISDLFDLEAKERLETLGYLQDRKILEADTNRSVLEGYASQLKALRDINEERAKLVAGAPAGAAASIGTGTTIIIQSARFEGPASGESWADYMERMMGALRADYAAQTAGRR